MPAVELAERALRLLDGRAALALVDVGSARAVEGRRASAAARARARAPTSFVSRFMHDCTRERRHVPTEQYHEPPAELAADAGLAPDPDLADREGRGGGGRLS